MCDSNNKQAIIFKDIRKNFGLLEVLKGISGYVDSGEVVGIIGPSGCGKSTLLRCFNSLETIDSGNIVVNGIDITQPGLKLTRLRTEVGMVFQQFNLFPHMSVLENLTIAPLKVLGKSYQDSKELALVYLEKVGLSDKANYYPEQLSGGQKQRVAIARSLCMEPKIMLFDEPTSALDPELVGEVLMVIQQLASEGMTMVIVTHEMHFAREVANRVIFLNEGYVEEEGIASHILTNPQSKRLQIFLSRMNFGRY